MSFRSEERPTCRAAFTLQQLDHGAQIGASATSPKVAAILSVGRNIGSDFDPAWSVSSCAQRCRLSALSTSVDKQTGYCGKHNENAPASLDPDRRFAEIKSFACRRLRGELPQVWRNYSAEIDHRSSTGVDNSARKRLCFEDLKGPVHRESPRTDLLGLPVEMSKRGRGTRLCGGRSQACRKISSPSALPTHFQLWPS